MARHLLLAIQFALVLVVSVEGASSVAAAAIRAKHDKGGKGSKGESARISGETGRKQVNSIIFTYPSLQDWTLSDQLRAELHEAVTNSILSAVAAELTADDVGIYVDVSSGKVKALFAGSEGALAVASLREQHGVLAPVLALTGLPALVPTTRVAFEATAEDAAGVAQKVTPFCSNGRDSQVDRLFFDAVTTTKKPTTEPITLLEYTEAQVRNAAAGKGLSAGGLNQLGVQALLNANGIAFTDSEDFSQLRQKLRALFPTTTKATTEAPTSTHPTTAMPTEAPVAAKIFTTQQPTTTRVLLLAGYTDSQVRDAAAGMGRVDGGLNVASVQGVLRANLIAFADSETSTVLRNRLQALLDTFTATNHVCADFDGWEDKDGYHCKDYLTCKNGRWHDKKESYYAQFAVNSVSARQACCACGGGEADSEIASDRVFIDSARNPDDGEESSGLYASGEDDDGPRNPAAFSASDEPLLAGANHQDDSTNPAGKVYRWNGSQFARVESKRRRRRAAGGKANTGKGKGDHGKHSVVLSTRLSADGLKVKGKGKGVKAKKGPLVQDEGTLDESSSIGTGSSLARAPGTNLFIFPPNCFFHSRISSWQGRVKSL